jgi:hypothetical protein
MLAACPLRAAEPTGGTVEKGNFRFVYDERGVSGLANPQDPFRATAVVSGQRLRPAVRFRVNGDDWQSLDADGFYLAAPPHDDSVAYTNHATGSPLKVTQTFRIDGAALDWSIELECATNSAVEVGDLAISVPVAGPWGAQEPKEVFERRFVRHQFISGHGSFVYFVRASGAPPFLLMTVRPGTKLEYFAGWGGGGRGGGQLFVHSAASGADEKRGTWRQEHTSLRIGPVSTREAKVTYGFRFHWAQSHGEMRDILFKEGLFDIRAVPGMTVPEDLTARFSLRTRARIDAIEAEFPQQTRITKLGGSPRCSR